MKTLLSTVCIALALVAVPTSGAHADNVDGTCNRIIANALNAAQVCWNFECLPTDLECAEVGAALLGFFGAPGCGAAFASGELEGLTNSAVAQPEGAPDAGATKHLTDVICGSVVDCDFCLPAVALGVCGGFCP